MARRAGRAHPALLEPVRVEAYGNAVPINQVGSIATPEPRMITVQVWDKGLAKAVDKAIRDAGLPQPACGWAISPWIDMEALGEDLVGYDGDVCRSDLFGLRSLRLGKAVLGELGQVNTLHKARVEQASLSLARNCIAPDSNCTFVGVGTEIIR